MDGESLLYIIIAIVYFVVSILNSRKKAKEKKKGKGKPRPVKPKQTVPAPAEPTLDDIIGELFGGEKQAPAPPKPVAEPVLSDEYIRQQQLQKEHEARRARQRAHDAKMQMLAVSQANIRKNRAAQKETSRVLGRTGGKVYGKLNLRDAIIAQVILDRPYK